MLTPTQRKALAIMPKFTGLLSMIGSAFIFTDVARDATKWKQTYSRIMLAMSCVDCVASFMYFLSTWPIPAGSESLWAAGTTGTCTLQGFFIQLSLAAPLYNLTLALHYLAVIKYGWSDRRLARAERLVHPVIFTIAVGLAVAGLPLRTYNDANVWCWIAPHERMDHPDSANWYRWALFYVELWSIIVIISGIMIMVVTSVFRIEGRTKKFSAKKQASTSEAVKRQAFYYLSAFYITWVFPTTMRTLQTVEVHVPYAIFLCAVVFTPLQGFFNGLIYARPRYLTWRRKRETEQQRVACADNRGEGAIAGEEPLQPLLEDQEEEMNVDVEVALAKSNRWLLGNQKEEEDDEEEAEEAEEKK